MKNSRHSTEALSAPIFIAAPLFKVSTLSNKKKLRNAEAPPPNISIDKTLYSVVKENKINNLYSIIYIIALVLIISWAVGFFVFNAGAIIHLMLTILCVPVMLKIIQGNNS